MSEPLKVGDRVSVSWIVSAQAATISGPMSHNMIEKGIAKISRIDGDMVSLNGLTWEGPSGCGPSPVFVGQCRKLVKKERRRVFVVERDGSLLPSHAFTTRGSAEHYEFVHEGCGSDKVVEFVEVRRKK